MGAEVLRELKRGRSDGSRCAIDEHSLASLNVAASHKGQRDQPTVRNRGGLFVAHVRGCAIDEAALRNTGVLRVTAEAERREGVHALSDTELRDACAGSFDLARQDGTQD